MRIERITKIDEKVVNAFKNLIPQLTGRINEYPSFEDLEKIADSNNIFLLAAIEQDEIIGSLTLVLYRIPTGMKAIIEDVVVNETARGKGAATVLLNKAIDIAQENGVQKIELTSNPSRVAANKMYQKLGFIQRETNFYRLNM